MDTVPSHLLDVFFLGIIYYVYNFQAHELWKASNTLLTGLQNRLPW